MIEENVFIPKIFLCGSLKEFFARVENRPFEIVGQVQFFGKINDQEFNFLRDGKFLLNGKLVEHPELIRALKERVIDFIIFNESTQLNMIRAIFNRIGCPRSQVMTLREFNNLPLDGFYDMYADIQLLMILKNLSVKTLLDVDAHFTKSRLFTKESNDLTEIDCICQENFLPIKENLFRHVYKNFSDCHLRHYDAALINEKSPADFDSVFSMLEYCTNLVIIFLRNNSPLVAHIQNIVGNFVKVDAIRNFTSTWLFCYRHTPPEDFAMYVVTHKKLSPEHVDRLPEGYKIIHAGRAGKKDLGYLGDDTGDNISHLNPYINELTAIYWIWKNTSHTIIGHCSYRRFFTISEEKPFNQIDDNNFSYEKVLSKQDALNLLADCDIVVTRLACQDYPQFEELKNSIGIGIELIKFAETVMKKYLLQTHPDYADAFDYVMNSPSYYQCHMFITRRNIFDVYCKWLFSFILDALKETFQRTTISKFSPYAKRLIGFFSERMFSVWLIKNRLQIKEINKMFLLKNVDG